MRRDIGSDLKFVSSVPPAAARTATTTGAVVDTQGYEGVLAVVHMGVNTDGEWTPKLQEGDASDGSDMADVAAGDLVENGFVLVTTSNDDAIFECGYIGRKRYVRVVVTETTASTGGFFSAAICLGLAHAGPA